MNQRYRYMLAAASLASFASLSACHSYKDDMANTEANATDPTAVENAVDNTSIDLNAN